MTKSKINLSKILPGILLMIGAGSMYPLIQGVQTSITLAQERVRLLENQLPILRTRAQQLPVEENRIKELENQLKRYTAQPNPEALGAASISRRLQSRGWVIRSITTFGNQTEGDLQKTAFRIEFSVDYEGLLDGLRSLANEAAIPQSMTVALATEKAGQLEGTLVIQVLRVRL